MSYLGYLLDILNFDRNFNYLREKFALLKSPLLEWAILNWQVKKNNGNLSMEVFTILILALLGKAQLKTASNLPKDTCIAKLDWVQIYFLWTMSVVATIDIVFLWPIRCRSSCFVNKSKILFNKTTSQWKTIVRQMDFARLNNQMLKRERWIAFALSPASLYKCPWS